MYYSQASIDGLMAEHVAIRGNLNQVLESTREWQNLLAARESALPDTNQTQDLNEKRAGLRQSMSYLRDGLQNHHIHENEVMPSLIGNLLMQAIRIEHTEMMDRFAKIDAILVNADLETFLNHGSETLKLIKDLSDFARSHSSKEDGILYFLKRIPSFSSVR